QHVAADPVGEPVPDRPQVQVVLAGAEVLLDVGEVLVGLDGGGGGQLAGGDGGADDVDAVEGGLGVDAVLVTPPGEGSFADAGDEVLGGFALVDHLAHLDTDRGGVFRPPGLHLGGDLGEVGLGGGQQPLPVRFALGREQRVVAG